MEDINQLELTAYIIVISREIIEYSDKTILVSTHGCALKAILANINHTPIEKFWGEGFHKNCGITIVEVENGEARILVEGKVYPL